MAIPALPPFPIKNTFFFCCLNAIFKSFFNFSAVFNSHFLYFKFHSHLIFFIVFFVLILLRRFAFFLHSKLKIFKFRFAQNEIFLKCHYEKKQRGFVLFAHFSFQNFADAHFSSKRQPPIIVITKITIMASQKKK